MILVNVNKKIIRPKGDLNGYTIYRLIEALAIPSRHAIIILVDLSETRVFFWRIIWIILRKNTWLDEPKRNKLCIYIIRLAGSRDGIPVGLMFIWSER